MAVYDKSGNVISTLVSNNSLQNYIYPSIDAYSVPYYPGHDTTFVGDNIWAFNAPTDGGAIKVYNTSLVLQKSMTHNFYFTRKNGTTYELRMKSVDYNPVNEVLMVGNGYGPTETEGLLFMFYDCDDWLSMSATIDFTNCGSYSKIDVTELGSNRAYGFWAGKCEENDQIYLTIGEFADIYLLRLGKGTNQLAKGTYASADASKYNGTWEILKHWTQKETPATPFAPHGGQAYNGCLYAADNLADTCRIFKVNLNDDGYMTFDVLDLVHYSNSGNGIVHQAIDGMCIKDGIIYASPLRINGAYNYAQKVVFKIKI